MHRNIRHNNMFTGHRIIIPLILCLFGLCLLQSFMLVPKTKGDSRVHLIHSDELYYDMYGNNPDAQIVKGKVRFMHNGGFLDCDSAYFYQELNSVRAFGHVKYTQGDTLSLTCERAFYDGQAEMMEARRNVVLRHRTQYLYTDSLNYDRIYSNAYFYDGGKLIDGKDQLVSDWGEYNTETKKAVFYYKVVMLSDNRRVETDTLHYDTNTSIAHALGPSVVTSDTTIVHTTDGYFHSKTDALELYSRSTIIDGQKTIVGDTLFYDKTTGDMLGKGQVDYHDKENKNVLNADYLQYNEQTGFGYATNKALVKDYSQGDTLYVHADTLKIVTFDINTDSVRRELHCYNKVRAYRSDMQAICDSLVGYSCDSLITLYKDPIVWNGSRQVLGEVINVYMADSTIREAQVIGQALIVEKCDEENHYNQISSKRLDSYFTDGALRKTVATGAVKVLFYPVDDKDSTLMFLDHTETDTLRMYFSEERQVEKIWTSKHTSVMYPMTQIPPDKYKLQEFAWFEELRPVDKDDVFNWRGKGEESQLKIIQRAPAPVQTFDEEAPVMVETSSGDEEIKEDTEENEVKEEDAND